MHMHEHERRYGQKRGPCAARACALCLTPMLTGRPPRANEGDIGSRVHEGVGAKMRVGGRERLKNERCWVLVGRKGGDDCELLPGGEGPKQAVLFSGACLSGHLALTLTLSLTLTRCECVSPRRGCCSWATTRRANLHRWVPEWRPLSRESPLQLYGGTQAAVVGEVKVPWTWVGDSLEETDSSVQGRSGPFQPAEAEGRAVMSVRSDGQIKLPSLILIPSHSPRTLRNPERRRLDSPRPRLVSLWPAERTFIRVLDNSPCHCLCLYFLPRAGPNGQGK